MFLDPLDGRAFGVPFKPDFAKGPMFFWPRAIHKSSPSPDHKDERHNSSDWPSAIIYTL